MQAAHPEAGHDPHLAHHFETPQQQFESGKQGMWLFLATEVLLFGGLFCAYAVYRSNHPEIFYYGHQFLSIKWGAINTVVLICSSLTMAWSVRAAQLGNHKALIANLVMTLLMACAFLGIKGIEYHEKWQHGLLWASQYHPKHEEHAAPVIAVATAPATLPAGVPASPEERTMLPEPAQPPQGTAVAVADGGHELPFGGEPKKASIFFSIYFLMTGLHGIHVVCGMIAILWLIVRAMKRQFGPRYFSPVDFVGLYWHLVDLIWIYLFPLLYLIH